MKKNIINEKMLSIAKDEIKDNEEIMLSIALENPDLIVYASKRLLNDKNFWIKFMSKESKHQKEQCWKYLGDDVKNDCDLVLMFIKLDILVLSRIDTELKNNSDFIIKAINIDVFAINLCNRKALHNKDDIYRIKDFIINDPFLFSDENELLEKYERENKLLDSLIEKSDEKIKKMKI